MVLTIPVEEISAQARRVDGRRALLVVARTLGTVLLSAPYVAGWTMRKLWLGAVMLWTAFRVGWREAGRARGTKGGADV